MGEHFCEFAITWKTETGELNKLYPVFCDQPASLKLRDHWYCAEHFDEMEPYLQATDELNAEWTGDWENFENSQIFPVDSDPES